MDTSTVLELVKSKRLADESIFECGFVWLLQVILFRGGKNKIPKWDFSDLYVNSWLNKKINQI